MNKNIHNLIDKLASQEEEFLKSEFLSPVLNGQPVMIRIAGIVMTMRIIPGNFQGWGVFKPTSRRLAKHVRAPSMVEKRKYLDLFPALRFILHHHNQNTWFGTPYPDARFQISGSVPIYLCEEVQLFDQICARFDSHVCWFDEVDSRKSPKNANYLRESLANLRKPEQLDGLSREEIEAYQVAHKIAYETSEEAQKEKELGRIKTALKRAGAGYRSHIERGDTFTIEYVVDGHTHRSVVSKDNLSVISAGICLSGYDRDFDLQSLAGVIAEGHNKDHIFNTEGRNWNQYGYHGHHNDDDYGDDDW